MFKVGDKIRIRNVEFIYSIKEEGSNTKVLKLPGDYRIKIASLNAIAGRVGTIKEINPDNGRGCEHRHVYWVAMPSDDLALPIEILMPLTTKPITRRPLCK